MTYVYSAIASFIVGMLAFFIQSVVRENLELKKKNKSCATKEENAIKEGITCILRDMLIANHKKYMHRGSISTHGLQNWISMYNAYKDLGGNGMILHMKNDIEELPIE